MKAENPAKPNGLASSGGGCRPTQVWQISSSTTEMAFKAYHRHLLCSEPQVFTAVIMNGSNWKPNIHSSSSTVEVSVIDSTAYLRNVAGKLLVDPVYPGYEKTDIPSYCFLIHHKASGKRVLFDLGLRTNWKTHLSPHLLEFISGAPFEVSVEKDVSDILLENGVQLGDIDAVIYSHHHWDHVGDPTKFPSSTSLVVGPGYKDKYLPGWPVCSSAAETTSDLYEGRETIEINFHDSKSLKIGQFDAHDYFGDGSFYLLNAPGHTTGHLMALARTTSPPPGSESQKDSTFILMAGDTVHHCAVFRPTEYHPLPPELEGYAKIHRTYEESPEKANITPFCMMPDAPYDEDLAEAHRTVEKMLPFDAIENVFTIYSHDPTLLGIIDLFPLPANEWKSKQWGSKGHWSFLKPLKSAAK